MVRGKGRRAKVTRGGGRHFSNNMGVGNGVKKDRRSHSEEDDVEDSDEGSDEDSDDSKEDDSEEESSEEESGPSATQPVLTRTQKRDRKKQQAEEQQEKEEEVEDPDLINPNHVQQKMNISDLNNPRELSRREKEQKAKQEAKDRYWKLHVQGKTDEAKADLSRLAKIRAEREAAQAKRQAEAEAKAAEAEAKKQAQLAKRTT